jgi:hypothetical protein
MKSKCAVIIGVMAMICFLFAGVTVSLAQGEGKVQDH